jgi:tetratricopeptide (TPR) repeat protein
MHRNWEGDYAEAARLQSEGLSIAREHNLFMPLLYNLFGCGIALTGKGDYDGALAMFTEGLAHSEKVGDELYRHRLLNSLGWLHSELGDLDRAIDLNRRATEIARKRSDHESIANAEINLGDIFRTKGDLVLSQEFLDGVLGLVKDPATSDWMKWRYSTHLFASLGALWLAKGASDKAQEFTDRCLELATRFNSRKYVVEARRLQAEIALARGQRAEAEGALRHALAMAQTIGNPTQLWKTHLVYGRFYAEAKRVDAARSAYRAARDAIEGIQAKLQDPALRAGLENSPGIRHVYELAALS